MRTIDCIELIKRIALDLSHYRPAISDKIFLLPEKNEVKTLLKKSFIDDYGYLVEKFDCDDYCLVLNAFIKQQHYINASQFAWAFGECFGLFGQSEHAMNICLCSDNIFYLIEPQTDELRTVQEKDCFQWLRI